MTLLIAEVIAVYCLFFVPPPDTPSWNVFFRGFFRRQEPVAAVLGLGILFGGLIPGVRRQGGRLVEWAGRHPVTLANAFFLAAAVGTWVIYRAHPLSMDEYAPWFQSKAFAAGRLTGSFPPALLDWLIPRGFQEYFFFFSRDTGRVASAYWPGYALLMAPFSVVGVQWLLNPVLGGVSVWLVHRVALEITRDHWLAGMAAILMVASPAVGMNAISFYSMPAHVALNLGYTYLLLQPSPGRLLFAGFVGSVALVLHNPIPHALYATPWLIWLGVGRDRRRGLPYLLLGYAPVILFVGLGWAALLATLGGPVAPSAGSAKGPFLDLWIDRLGQIVVWPTGRVLMDRLLGLMKLWLWAVPGLPLLAILGLHARWAFPVARLLAASATATILFYFLVPFDQGHGWGYRYFHSAWATLPLLGALALSPLQGRAEGSSSLLRNSVAGIAILSLILGTTLRAIQVGSFMSWQYSQRPTSSAGTPHVVLIKAPEGSYAEDLVQNDPFLRNSPLYLESRGVERDRRMLQAFFPGLVQLSSDSRGEVWGTR